MGTHREEKIQPRGTVTFSPVNLRDMEYSIKNKEFKTVTELVNFAIHFYFENRENPSAKDEVKQWLVSEDGESFMKGLIVKVREEQSK